MPAYHETHEAPHCPTCDCPYRAPIADGGGDVWGRFASWLLDKCEGMTVSEEMLQQQVSAMLSANYGQPATSAAIESLSRQETTRASEAGDSELLNVIDLIRTGKDGRKYDYAISRADTMVHVAPLFAAIAAAPAPGGE